jgi:hypothetical protein
VVPGVECTVVEGLDVAPVLLAAFCSAEGVDVALGLGFGVWPLTLGAAVPLTLGTVAALSALGFGLSSPRVKVRRAAAATVRVTAPAIALGIGFDT